MACDLVAVFTDLPHQRRVSLGHPAEHEERGAGPGAIEQVEEPAGVCVHAGVHAVPVIPGNRLGQRRDVKVVFHVHGHCIDWRIAHPDFSRMRPC